MAQGRLNLKDFATHIPSQHNLTVKLRPLSKKERGARNYVVVVSYKCLPTVIICHCHCLFCFVVFPWIRDIVAADPYLNLKQTCILILPLKPYRMLKK